MSEAAPVRVVLTRALRTLFDEVPAELSLAPEEAPTVDALLRTLNARWPGMRDRLADTRPAVRKHIKIFVAGRPARLETEIPPGAEVYVLTAISGG